MRRLNAEELKLWKKVVESVRPIRAAAPEAAEVEAAPASEPARKPRRAVVAPLAPVQAAKVPGTTLDGTWDRRLSRGAVQPDSILDLHGHNLATAYDLLDSRLETAKIGRASCRERV